MGSLLVLFPSRRAVQGAAVVVVAAFVATVLIILLSSARVAEREPDEFFYFEHAEAVVEDGVWAKKTDGDGPLRAPVAAPGFPLLVAGAMALDSGFLDTVECLTDRLRVPDPAAVDCGDSFGAGGWLLAILMGWAVAATAAGGALLTGRASVGALAALLMVASGLTDRFGHQFLTEALTLPVVFTGTVLLLAWVRLREAGYRGNRILAAAGLAFGIAAMTRPTLLYLLPVFTIAVLWLAGSRLRWMGGGLFLAGAMAVVVPMKVWTAAAAVPPSIEGEGDYRPYVVPARLSLNLMTGREYAAGWVYWLPDFGDQLALDLFGQEAVARFDFDNPEGFYLGVSRQLFLEAEAIAERTGRSTMDVMVWDMAVDQLPMHAATTPLLAWRGLFVRKWFGLVGVLLVVLAFYRPPFGATRRDLCILLGPAATLLLFQAGVSINIPRYNLSLMLPYMTIGAAMLMVAPMRLIGRLTGGTVLRR